MPVPLPSHETLKLPIIGRYQIHNPCHWEGQFEVNQGAPTPVSPGGSASFSLQQPGSIQNTGNVELTVTMPTD